MKLLPPIAPEDYINAVAVLAPFLVGLCETAPETMWGGVKAYEALAALSLVTRLPPAALKAVAHGGETSDAL